MAAQIITCTRACVLPDTHAQPPQEEVPVSLAESPSHQASTTLLVFPRRHSERFPHQDWSHSPSRDSSFTAARRGCLGTAVKGVSQKGGQTSLCRAEGMTFQCSTHVTHTRHDWVGLCARPPTLGQVHTPALTLPPCPQSLSLSLLPQKRF